jgi:hypothetical protein
MILGPWHLVGAVRPDSRCRCLVALTPGDAMFSLRIAITRNSGVTRTSSPGLRVLRRRHTQAMSCGRMKVEMSEFGVQGSVRRSASSSSVSGRAPVAACTTRRPTRGLRSSRCARRTSRSVRIARVQARTACAPL